MMAVLVTNRVANKRVCFLTVDHGAGGQLAREVDKIVARVAEVGVLRGVDGVAELPVGAVASYLLRRILV
jgi:hypothetical protein